MSDLSRTPLRLFSVLLAVTWLICSLLVSSVATAETAAEDQGRREAIWAELAKVDQFVWNGLLFLKDKSSLKDVRKLARLQREETKTVVNKHAPRETYEFKTLIFEGLTLYGFVTPKQELGLTRVIITNPRWKIREGLDVGTSADRIERVLGTPKEKGAEFLKYEGETEQVHFYVQKNRITKVEFFHYFD